MSGWMKYPYQKCLQCEKFNYRHKDDIVNNPYETCAEINDCDEEKGEE